MPIESPAAFIDRVLRLEPKVAAFDCDGTVWSGDVGEEFFAWELKKGIVSETVALSMRSRYAEYKAGKIPEAQMCGEMVTMHKGMTDAAVMQAATDYFEHSFSGHIFPEMRELIARLQQKGCDIWAVSSSSDWLIRASMKQFGISDNRILATAVEIDEGVVTDRIVRIPSGPGKPQALREAANADIDAAFGNSRWDTEMLAMAKHAFAVNPTLDLENTARKQNWTIYFPDGTSSRAQH
jgi:HAD superfamily phosphoserine phosphatase-like hydrolase